MPPLQPPSFFRSPLPPLLRSKLFVPGHRQAWFDKALNGDADAVSFDLEDAVAPEAKPRARDDVAALLGGVAARRAAPLKIVRINGAGTPWFEADLAAVAVDGVDLINLPKVERAADVAHAVQALERAEQANRVARPIALLVNIETPGALLQAAGIAAAHPRVAGLQLGLGDLFAPHGIDRRDAANVHAAMFTLRMAAAACGRYAVDGAWPAIDDLPGFRAEALQARRLGYVGKSCIHPGQVAAANEVFAADPAEVARARRVVEAAAAAAPGGGVLKVDGQMVDGPYLQRARALVAAAERARPRTGASAGAEAT